MPIFLIITILFTLWLHYELKKNNREENKVSDDFWKREHDANFVRPKDLSTLSYITIDIESLPFHVSENDSIKEVEASILALCDKKLLNLSGLSNTDIKYQYGAKNFEMLSVFDQNFLLLLRHLNKWGKLLYEENHREDAKKVLLYAIFLGSDIKTTFSLLARIYHEEGNIDQIRELLKKAESLTTLLKPALLEELSSYLS
ncbi:MAG: hypothetical protein PWP24_959 [Clostridiales bacterium]|nr:hypothetical protein [Clostridiales bacterium]